MYIFFLSKSTDFSQKVTIKMNFLVWFELCVVTDLIIHCVSVKSDLGKWFSLACSLFRFLAFEKWLIRSSFILFCLV